MENMEELIKSYESRKDAIKSRLKDFDAVIEGSDEDIFAELAFCLCTPQSKARFCNLAIESMRRNNVLYRGESDEIRPFLNAVRFCDTKAASIVKAREMFTEDGRLRIKDRIFSFSSPDTLREWLVGNVHGMGMKEASHFMRNIGMGTGLAILDRHILKNLKKFGVIGDVKSLTDKKYLEIEGRMREFSEKVGIPLEEMDLLFWSEETGEIFK
jgi:N-glycosylase/DNA lyase